MDDAPWPDVLRDPAGRPAQRRLRLAFLGSGGFGLPTLKALSELHDVVAVVTQPDRPAGRGMKLTPTPIGEFAAASLPGVPLHKPQDINAPEALAAVRALAGPGKADAWVIIAFGQKLSEPLLEGIFACNLHASILPRWRGAAPINWSVLSGDSFVGNSVITIAQRMDAGLVLGGSTYPMEPQRTAGDLHDLLAADGPMVVLKVLSQYAGGRRPGADFGDVQDERLVSRAKKLGRADAWVDLQGPAENCRRTINGLSPWPGVDAVLAWDAVNLRVKLSRAIVAARAAVTGAAPGELIDPREGIFACGDGSPLQLLELQPVGLRVMTWQQFANGRRPAKGAMLTSAQQLPGLAAT